MRIIVTGSPHWTEPRAVTGELARLYLQHGPYVLVHKAGGTGVDAATHEFQEVAGEALGIFEVRHPADYETHGKDARVRKGAELVQKGADLLVAFQLFDDEDTAQIVKLAEEAGIPVKKVYA